jgi:hypothetical protein
MKWLTLASIGAVLILALAYPQPGRSDDKATAPATEHSPGLTAREAEVKEILGIRSDQEAAWARYVVARRQHAEDLKKSRREKLMSWAQGNARLDMTMPALAEDPSLPSSKEVLRHNYDELYAVLDPSQKALADRELTASECGR